jgi:protein-tyrosine kinase
VRGMARVVVQDGRQSSPARVAIVARGNGTAAERSAPDLPEPALAGSFRLDTASLYNQRCLVPGNLSSAFAREINVVKRNLWRRLQDREPGQRSIVLLVSSTKAGEGKSFLGLNLALSFLFADSRRVLLVDADTEHRGLSKRLGLGNSSGLTELLEEGGASIEQALLRSERHELEIIPAGRPSPAGASRAACGSERLVVALRRLAAPDAVVVIDAPPLLTAPVAYLLAEYVDQVILVVGAGQSRLDEIGLALAQLPDQERVSFILNRAVAAPASAGSHGPPA